MEKSIFNLAFQQNDIGSKIVVALERISEAFRALLWEHAKTIGLSPIQIQILIFTAYHKEALCNVSHLAKEFNVTKPTISDAVRVLEKKGLITKHTSAHDNRRYSIALSPAGQQTVKDTESFAKPIKQQVNHLHEADLLKLFSSLNQLIFGLNRTGILSVQRTCYGCQFYEKTEKNHYCHLIDKELLDRDIRVDCPEYEEKGSE